MKHLLTRPSSLISIVFLALALLHFSPVSIAHKLAFPLAFLTLCALRFSTWPMVLAMGFSALGDYMGTIHNFWGQMGFFALAHMAYIVFFCRTSPKDKTSEGMKWKSSIVALYGLTVGMLIVPHVHGFLQAGVSVYVLLILTMCILAWRQKNPFYAWGAWLFVFSDTILAWNKFVSPIAYAGHLIMVPYYLGQWMLFIQSMRERRKGS
jgi:alkenylglycerophosphocholine/alkenylglycerophosphoethanolamine hydrolase